MTEQIVDSSLLDRTELWQDDFNNHCSDPWTN